MANEENNKIYLVRGNDAPLSVCLRKREGDGDPVPYDLSAAERVRLALVGHGVHIFATDVTVTGEDSNIVSGVIPGRALLKGDYDLEVTFKSGGRDKRFAVEDMFTAVDFLAEDADGEAEGEGDGISITVTVQPEVIEIAGPTGPQGRDGKSAYEVWLEDGHTGTEDDFFEWLASEGLPWNDVDISSLTVRNGYITSSGVWNSGSTYCHTLLPVSAGKAVRVTAAESNLFRYAWLTSGQAPRGGIAADLVPGTERTDVAAGSSVTLAVPEGAKYLYIYLGTPAAKANTPESLAVSDTISSLRSGIDDASENIGVIATEIRYSGVYGHFDGAGSVTVYGGNIFVVAGMSYRLIMLHPDITVTDPTGNVWRLVVSARDDSGTVISNLVQVSDVSRLSDHYDLTIPAGATRLYIYGRCAAGQTCDYVLERLDTVTYNDGDILTLNPDSEFQPKWQSAAKPYYTSRNTNRPNCVRFLHISDVHGNWANVRRFLKFYNHWVDKGYDITAINTGDTATDYLTDGVTGYTSIDGVDKILGVVGNHDTRGTSGWQQYKGLEVYNALFAPLISGWGVIQPEGAAENGYCYYYKDYATNKLRLVVVDIMGYDDTEDAWLASVLASAKTAGYHVLIATHFAGGRSSAEASQPPYKKIDCQWSTMAGLASDSTQLNGYNSESYKMADTVHAFMEDGGIFCGYMCGHSHLEFVARLDKYPDQMIYTIGSSKSGKVHDYTHTTGTRMQDEFEILAVDTDSKFVKLYKVGANYDRRGRLKDSVCVSYDTHEVVGFPVTVEALSKEMDGKQDRLVSGENIKSINGESVLGEGNIVIQGGSADVVKYTEQTLTDSQKAQARTNIGAANESEVSQLRSEAVVKAATTPTNVLYIADENGNEVLGLEKALLSRAAALFLTDGNDGLLRVADAYPAIHADFSVSQGICEIYVRIGKTNKYVKFNYCHDVDTSEEVYKNIWRIGRSSPSAIVGAVFCEYDGVTFSSTGKSALTSLENEFTMQFVDKGDHTGGTHGDERIDLDPSCYIQFIADGAQMDMSSDFHIDCRSFRVVQKSTLHETQEGGVVIVGHPIIGWHTKTTDFVDGGYHIRNFIRVDLQNNAASMTTVSVYSGLTCIHKDAATKVWDESGFLFDATGSGTTYWGIGTNRYNHGKTPYTFMANATNKISCEVESHENGEIEGTLVSNSESEFTSYADRTSDTKYYCYEPNRVLVTGNRISLEMSVKFNVE